MTVDKLREILIYYPADIEIEIKDKYGDLVNLDNMVIINKVEGTTITKIIIKPDWD